MVNIYAHSYLSFLSLQNMASKPTKKGGEMRESVSLFHLFRLQTYKP